MQFRNAFWAPLCATALLGLTACHGSSSSDEPTDSPLEITEDNAKLVVSAATESLRFAPSSLGIMVEVLDNLADYGLEKASPSEPEAVALSGKVTPLGSEDSTETFSVDCDNSGTLSGSVTDTPVGEAGYRYTVTLDASNCRVDEAELIFDGAVTYVEEEEDLESGFAVDLDFTFDRFSLDEVADATELEEIRFYLPVGVTLSGGVDMNLTVNFMAEEFDGPYYSFDELSVSSPEAAFKAVTLTSGTIELSPFEDTESEEPREGLALETDDLALSIDLDGNNTIEIDLETESALTVFSEMMRLPGSSKVSPMIVVEEVAEEPEMPQFIVSQGILSIDGANDSNITLDTAKGGELELGYSINGGQETIQTHEKVGANFDYTVIMYMGGIGPM